MLAKAIIEFNKGNYKESLSLIRNIIIINPLAPSDMWFALGLCYYRTGNIPKAKLSFDKTLELDSQNSMALASLGIIEIVLGQDSFESRRKAIQFFFKALQANPRNTLAMKYLADHLFFRGEFGQCKEFCEAALNILRTKQRPQNADSTDFRQEVESLKSNFYFIMGKIEHAQDNFQQAFLLYEQALRHNSKNYEAHLCMAKVQFYLGNFQGSELNLTTVLSQNKFKDSYEAIRILA